MPSRDRASALPCCPPHGVAAAPPRTTGRRPRYDLRGEDASAASTTTSSTPASTRSTPSSSAPAARRRRGLRRARRDRDLVADPARSGRAARSTPSSRPRPSAPSARRSLGGARADDAEAWFYLGGAYARRVQWRVLREEKLAAARDGKRIKEALERAIALDPDLDDAYFGIGMYRYYADVAPAAAKILRFLLLLPGGDRDRRPRADAARARRAAGCCRAKPTTSSTSSISGTSSRTDRARRAPASRCTTRYPGNPLFLVEIARDSGHVSARHHGQPRYVADAARRWRASSGSTSRRSPRCGPGWASPDSSTRSVRPITRSSSSQQVVDAKPAKRRRRAGAANLALGEARIVSAIATPRWPPTVPRSNAAPASGCRDHRVSARRNGCAHAPDAARAEAYRLSLEGLRKLERWISRAPKPRSTRSVALERRRSGRALSIRTRPAGATAGRPALAQFELTHPRAQTRPRRLRRPRTSKRRGCTNGRSSRRGDRDTTEPPPRWFGASSDTRAAANRALTRLKADALNARRSAVAIARVRRDRERRRSSIRVYSSRWPRSETI